MADEIAGTTPESNPAQERITQLSDKVRQEAEARTLAEAKAAEAEKKAAFADGYADILGTYPAAKEFKAEIQAKVNAGYSVKDAATVVLADAGKLGGSSPAPEPHNPAGGSATNTMTQSSDKSPNEMSTAEKRAALADLYG